MAAVVLAAGGGSRFAGVTHKLLAPVRGRPLVAWAFDAAADAGLDELIVVAGAVDLGGLVPPGATLVGNPRWHEGQATSLQAGVEAVGRAGHDALVVGLGDQPGVPSSAWRAVADAVTGPAGPGITVATYGGRRGNPVGLARAVWPLLPAHGDEGARAVMRRRPELVGEVRCPGDPADVDTMEDLERWS